MEDFNPYPTLFLNEYRCTCGAEWDDEWTCAVEDDCPDCGDDCEPYRSTPTTD